MDEPDDHLLGVVGEHFCFYGKMVAGATAQDELGGLNIHILPQIRAKEAQKLQAAMTRNPQQKQRLDMMARLPEMARVLRNVFVAEKKQALAMEVACQRMMASYRSLMTPGKGRKKAIDWTS